MESIFILLHLQKFQNQGFAHDLAIVGLLEVLGPGIVVHSHADLIDTGQGMHDDHILLGVLQLVRGQDIYIGCRCFEI